MSFARRTLAAAAVAVLAVASVSGAVIRSQTFTSTTRTPVTCTGTPTTSDITSGVCSPSGGATGTRQSSSARFCDANYIYDVSYADRTCTAANAISVQQTPVNQCTFMFSTGENNYFQNYVCNDPTTGDQFPLSFPPAGWAAYSQTMNRTSGQGASTCDDSAENYKIRSAGKVTGCSTANSQYTTQATQSFLNGDYSIDATYPDATCTAAPIRFEVTPLPTCAQGVSIESRGDSQSYSGDLPQTGYAVYGDEDETCSQTPERVVLSKPDCVSASTFVCNSGNTTATLTQFTSTDGTCPAGAVMSTTTRQATTSTTTGTCVKGAHSATRFFCQYDVAPFQNSASAAAASMVTLAAAMLVAFFGRAL